MCRNMTLSPSEVHTRTGREAKLIRCSWVTIFLFCCCSQKNCPAWKELNGTKLCVQQGTGIGEHVSCQFLSVGPMAPLRLGTEGKSLKAGMRSELRYLPELILMFWHSQCVLVAKLMFVKTSLVPEFVLWNSVIPTQQPAAWLLATRPQSSSPGGHSTRSAGAGGFVPVCHCEPAWQWWWDPSVGPEVSLQSANQLIASEDFTSST